VGDILAELEKPGRRGQPDDHMSPLGRASKKPLARWGWRWSAAG